MTETLTTPKVCIEYRRNDKQIFCRDLTDTNNEPASYTKSKRGLDKVWTAIKAHANTLTDLTHRDVMDIYQEHSIKYHYWCMMD